MRKIIPVVAAGATALALAAGTFGYATMDKAVTLSVDGQASEVAPPPARSATCWRARASRSPTMTSSRPALTPS